MEMHPIALVNDRKEVKRRRNGSTPIEIWGRVMRSYALMASSSKFYVQKKAFDWCNTVSGI